MSKQIWCCILIGRDYLSLYLSILVHDCTNLCLIQNELARLPGAVWLLSGIDLMDSITNGEYIWVGTVLRVWVWGQEYGMMVVNILTTRV